LARNNKIFQNKEIPANETVGKAIEILQNYKLNSNPDQITSTRVHPSTDCNNSSWRPPPRASIKLNVVAHLCSDGRLGLGLVLRDEDAAWLEQPRGFKMDLATWSSLKLWVLWKL
jgi:hypothetical protein